LLARLRGEWTDIQWFKYQSTFLKKAAVVAAAHPKAAAVANPLLFY